MALKIISVIPRTTTKKSATGKGIKPIYKLKWNTNAYKSNYNKGRKGGTNGQEPVDSNRKQIVKQET